MSRESWTNAGLHLSTSVENDQQSRDRELSFDHYESTDDTLLGDDRYGLESITPDIAVSLERPSPPHPPVPHEEPAAPPVPPPTAPQVPLSSSLAQPPFSGLRKHNSLATKHRWLTAYNKVCAELNKVSRNNVST